MIFEADMKWLEPDARKEMDSALARFDKIDAVYAHNDPGAHGAYLAAKAAGREKDIVFVGIDALPQEGVAYVAQGILSATFQYPTGGAEAIDTAPADPRRRGGAQEDRPRLATVHGRQRETRRRTAVAGLSRFSRRVGPSVADERVRREDGTVLLVARRGTGPCFRPMLSSQNTSSHRNMDQPPAGW